MFYGSFGGGYDPGFAVFGLIWHLLTFIFWIIVIIFLVRFLRRRGRLERWHSFIGKSAEDILKERYAKGEINTQEYEERLGTLHHTSSSSSQE